MKPLMSADALLKVNRRPGVKTKTIMHHHQETCISVYSLLHFFHSLSLDLDHDPYKCFKTFIGARLNYSTGTAVRSRFSNLPSPSSPSHQLQSCISAHFHTGIGAFSSWAVYGLVGMTFSLSSRSFTSLFLYPMGKGKEAAKNKRKIYKLAIF